jgi:hypothetical protein
MSLVGKIAWESQKPVVFLNFGGQPDAGWLGSPRAPLQAAELLRTGFLTKIQKLMVPSESASEELSNEWSS